MTDRVSSRKAWALALFAFGIALLVLAGAMGSLEIPFVDVPVWGAAIRALRQLDLAGVAVVLVAGLGCIATAWTLRPPAQGLEQETG